jgi:urease accessory protein
MRRSNLVALTAGIFLLAPGFAGAHTFGAEGAGFSEGFAHPFGGVDHLLAILAIGVWAAQIGRHARWTVPVASLAMIAVGGALGALGPGSSVLEPAIAGSLIVLGSLIATGKRFTPAVGAVIVGLAAILHGHAHGVEMPEAAILLAYAGGFILATAALHAIGVAIGSLERVGSLRWAIRGSGVAVALVGMALIAIT